MLLLHWLEAGLLLGLLLELLQVLLEQVSAVVAGCLLLLEAVLGLWLLVLLLLAVVDAKADLIARWPIVAAVAVVAKAGLLARRLVLGRLAVVAAAAAVLELLLVLRMKPRWVQAQP